MTLNTFGLQLLVALGVGLLPTVICSGLLVADQRRQQLHRAITNSTNTIGSSQATDHQPQQQHPRLTTNSTSTNGSSQATDHQPQQQGTTALPAPSSLPHAQARDAQQLLDGTPCVDPQQQYGTHTVQQECDVSYLAPHQHQQLVHIGKGLQFFLRSCVRILLTKTSSWST